MSPLNCCIKAKLKVDIAGWLIEESDIVQLWCCRMQLLRCPSCGQLWLWKSELVGHKEWILTWTEVASRLDFDMTVARQKSEDEAKQEKQKMEYEKLGLDWPSGRRK